MLSDSVMFLDVALRLITAVVLRGRLVGDVGFGIGFCLGRDSDADVDAIGRFLSRRLSPSCG